MTKPVSWSPQLDNNLSSQELTSTSFCGQIIERFENYAIVSDIHSHRIDFIVKEVNGELISSSEGYLPGAWCYGMNGEEMEFDKAEEFLTGQIKWDGCSNWDFHTSDCMAHFCGRKQATGIGRLMDYLYQIASERMENYNHEFAE